MDSVTVFAPGSTSNLGPGFDCLGVALAGRGDRVTATRTPASGVRVRRVSDPRIPLEAERNTAALSAAAVLRRAGREATLGLELEIDKGLPLSGGMGGSAASAVAGAVAAAAFLDAPVDAVTLMACALEAESRVAGRHADNIAPSLLGGAVVVLGTDPLRTARVRVHPQLRLVLATPDYRVETQHARAVLPAQVPLGEAVRQAANLGALLLALERADLELLGWAMHDRLAEPARAGLYPGWAEARRAALAAGAAGCCISGAGPSVLALSDAPQAAAVAEAFAAAYAGRGIQAVTAVLEVDPAGARRIA